MLTRLIPLRAYWLGVLCLGCSAGLSMPSYGYEEPPPWQEDQNIVLPALPIATNLIRFQTSATETYQFFIDSASLSVGQDRVIRYTLVSRSPNGVENISYEAIRCATKALKRYAFVLKGMNQKQEWVNNRAVEWVEIEYKGGNNPHLTLYKEYFCPEKTAIFNKEEGLAALKRGGDR